MIHVGENTWNLRVFVTDLQVEKTLRVKGEKNIGGVMVELVDSGIHIFNILICIFIFNMLKT